MKKIILFLLVGNVFAQTTPDQELNEAALAPIMIKETHKVKSGDTKIIPLPRFTFVDRISLEVRNNIGCNSGSFHLSLDGVNGQSVSLPQGSKGFRTKIVTMGATGRNIEVYNATNCSLKIKNIVVLPRRFNSQHGGGPIYVPLSEAAAHAGFLLESMRFLEELVGDQDQLQYISPIKKVLGKAMAVLNTSPTTSQASIKAIKDVLEVFSKSQEFIERLQSIQATFEIAQEIQATILTLERMIR